MRWLSEGAAAEPVVDAPAGALRAALERALASAPVDVIVQPAEHRSRRIVAAATDSALVGQKFVG